MSGGRATVVFDPSLTEYDFGPDHPMAPIRVDLTMSLARELDVVPELVDAPVATQEQLELVHTTEFIDAVKGMCRGAADEAHGLGTEDNPSFDSMHEASAHVVGASIEAARQVWSGESLHSANISGGLHHAMADRASGFCIYNDVAAAIAWLLEQGATRVAYVDIDAHHGDGVEKIFYDDPRVLTISLHETGQMLFPGTGYPNESGGPGDAEGSAVNVALPPGTGDSGWLRAFHAIVPPLLREWKPEILVTQHGCDSHREDPLAHLMLSVDAQRAATHALHDLAHELCAGRWLATGGGGYAVVDVVPRAWSHVLAVVKGVELDPSTPTPPRWRARVEELFGRTPPALMTDGSEPSYRSWEHGYDPEAWLDRAVQATRQAVFPLHGLDPYS